MSWTNQSHGHVHFCCKKPLTWIFPFNGFRQIKGNVWWGPSLPTYYTLLSSQKKVTYYGCYETFYLLTQTDTIFSTLNELEIEIPEHVVTFYLSASKQQYFLAEQINICPRTSGNISLAEQMNKGGCSLPTISGNGERRSLTSWSSSRWPGG